MKLHTIDYEKNIREMGKELSCKLVLPNNTEIDSSQIYYAEFSYETKLLSTCMKQLKLRAITEFDLNDTFRYNFGVKVGNTYEYLDYGTFIVYEKSYNEDTKEYEYTCYDNMLYTMKEYESIGIEFPLSVRDYIGAIASVCNLVFHNATDTFCNYDKMIETELYLEQGLTYRDALEELAQATGSLITIENDELCLKQPTKTHNKNLLNYGFTENTTQGVYSVVNDDYSITFDGINNNAHRVNLGEITYKPNTTYTMWYEIISGSFQPSGATKNWEVMLYNDNISSLNLIVDRTKTTNVKTFSFQDGKTTKPFLWFGRDGQSFEPSLSNFRVKFMIVEGEYTTETIPDFDKYQNKIIDSEYISDTNVKMGEKFGKVNSIVLSRGDGADDIYKRTENWILTSDTHYLANKEYAVLNGTDYELLVEGVDYQIGDEIVGTIYENTITDYCEIIITDNQIMNSDDRYIFLDDLYNTLVGLEYCINDYNSTGITFLEPYDLYTIKIDDNEYPTIMLSDTIIYNGGLKETIFADKYSDTNEDYSTASKTDKLINRTTLRVDKLNNEIKSFAGNYVSNSQYEQDKDSITSRVRSIEEENLNERLKSVETRTTDTYTKTEIQNIVNGIGTDGVKVSSVQTASATFDIDGLHIEQGGDTETTLNAEGLIVDDKLGTHLLQVHLEEGEGVVRTKNLYSEKYLVIGNSRFEDGVIENENCTCVFWLGGNN